MRQVVAERTELMGVLRDLPSGYHRDFQLIKPPLFRAHDRMVSALAISARVIAGLTFDAARLKQAGSDPGLLATQRALDQVRKGVAFRDAYRVESGEKT
jgi:argininosuccinate lyase